MVNAQTEDATSKQLITLAKASNSPGCGGLWNLPDGVTSYTQFIEKLPWMILRQRRANLTSLKILDYPLKHLGKNLR